MDNTLSNVNGPSVRVAGLGLLAAVVIYMGIAYMAYALLVEPPWAVDHALPVRFDFDGEGFDDEGWQLQGGWLTQSPDGNGANLITFPTLQTGTNATPYALQTAFYTLDAKAGLVFNLAAQNSLRSGHVIRISPAPDGDGSSQLLAGYVDEKGIFITQMVSNLPEIDPRTEPVLLSVWVKRYVYSIFVGTEEIAHNLPLHYDAGFTGVIGAGETGAAYDFVVATEGFPNLHHELSPVRDMAAASEDGLLSTTYDFGARHPLVGVFRGEWAIAEGALQQQAVDGFDFAAFLVDAFPGTTRVQVDIRHKAGIGAGLVFAAESPDALRGSHMVRFLDEERVIWGYYAEEGEGFQGQGNAVFTDFDVNPLDATLEVVLDGETYRVLVDGVPISEAIPLQTAGSYVGLTASNTVAHFDNLVIEVRRDGASE